MVHIRRSQRELFGTFPQVTPLKGTTGMTFPRRSGSQVRVLPGAHNYRSGGHTAARLGTGDAGWSTYGPHSRTRRVPHLTHAVTRTLQTVTALLILAALGMTIGMVGEEVTDRAAATAADRVRADRDFPPAAPDGCQTAALADTRAGLPDLGIDWRWADLDDRGAVGTALLRSRIAFLDPDLDCRDIPAVAYHEWTHIAQVDYYGGDGLLGGTITSDLVDEKSGRPHEVAVHEVVADCAAMLLADEHGDAHGPRPYLSMLGGCPPDTMGMARDVVTAAGVELTDSVQVASGSVGSAAGVTR